MPSEPEVNLKIKANSEDAQKAADDFKAKLDKITKGAYSVGQQGGAQGLGKAIGFGMGGSVGGAIGGLVGKGIGMVGNAVGQEVGQLGNVLKQSFQDVVRNDMIPGIASAVSQIQERRGAVESLKGELGEAAAFMSPEQLKQIGKPMMAMADLRARGGRNIDQAFLGFSGDAGLKESASIALKGVRSTITREEVIDINQAVKELKSASVGLKDGAKKYNDVFKKV